MPAWAKHTLQQAGVGVLDGTVLELTGCTTEEAGYQEELDRYEEALG